MYPLLPRNSTASAAYEWGHMSFEPRDSPPSPWSGLLRALDGSFAARAWGFLASEFILLKEGGEEFGRLRIHGLADAEVETQDLHAAIERAPHAHHRMLTGDAETLAAKPLNSPDTLEIWCGGRRYEARLSLLRNTALARASGGQEVARVTGGLTNRSYEAVFEAEDEGTLPVAVFLLYHTVALRRRAYQMGAKGG